jgi:hypothetical protein
MIYKKNKKQYFIAIQKDLFHDLEQTVVKHNLYCDEDDVSKIRMDKAVFLLDYINYQNCYRKGEVTKEGFIRIPSEILNVYLQKELKKYKEFLKAHNYITTLPYDEEKSFGYKVSYVNNLNTVDQNKSEYIIYEFLSMTYEQALLKCRKKNAQIEQKKMIADKSTRHLTKWINEENIQVDWLSAFKFINDNESLSKEQKEQYSYSLNRIRFHQWYYLRSANDNRLHSNLTNFPSVLRQFLSHRGQELVSLDIKTSQPYILAGIFNLIIEKSYDKLEVLKSGLRRKEVRDKFSTVMNSISLTSPTITDFRTYNNLVCNEDIYSYIGANLSAAFISSIKSKNNDGGYIDKVYNPSLKYKIDTSFKDIRSYCKVLVLEFMYCSVESNVSRLKEIRRVYPNAVNQFIYDFKFCKELNVPKRLGKRKRTLRQRAKIDKSKKLFAKFLQQLEAYIVLDVITKQLSKLFPQMFMVTIHDSIVVTKEYELEAKAFIHKKLYEMLGIEAEIKSEDW